MLAGHPVSPSEPVDHAWHLHLIYTKSYWQDMCRDVLGRDLHHSPTTGTPADGEKFADWYERTLVSYCRIFGEEPPRDIWPAPADHLKHAADERWVDTGRYWLIPRPRWLRRFFRR